MNAKEPHISGWRINNYSAPLQQVFPTVLAAAIIAALQITFVLAYAAVLLGQNSPFLIPIVGVLLTGTVISIIIIALLSSYPGSFGSAQDIPASLMSVMVMSIASAYALKTGAEDISFHTIIAAFMVTTLSAALFFLAMATFKLGRIIRFVPFPVIGGVLASTGWILTIVGLGMLVDRTIDHTSLTHLFSRDILARWLPGFMIAILMLVASKTIETPFAVPVIITITFIGIHLMMSIMGITVEDAQSRGMLLNVENARLSFGINPLTVADKADWALIARYWPLILSLCGLSALMVMIQVSSLEVAINQDMKINRELFANGMANLAIGGLGGLISYHHISDTSIAYHLGARTRMVGLLCAAFCALPFFIGTLWLGLFPIPVLASIILYLGLGFLYDWLIRSAKHLPLWEYFIIVAIFLIIMFYNFPEGIAAGVLCSVLVFIFHYSQVSVVDKIVSGEACRSVVVRSKRELHHLAEHDDSIVLIRLKGFLFFGSSWHLFDQIEAYINNNGQNLKTLVLDFAEVSNIDYSAVMGLSRVRRHLAKRDINLWLSNVPPASQKLLNSVFTREHATVSYFDNADQALEFSENSLLGSVYTPSNSGSGLMRLLSGSGLNENEIHIVNQYLERKVYKDQAYITHAGELENSFYIVDEGQIAIHQQRETENIRLRVLKPGMVVGEMAIYSGQPRTADIIALGVAIVYEFTGEQLDQLEKEHSPISVKIHRMLANRVTTMLADETHLQRIRD